MNDGYRRTAWSQQVEKDTQDLNYLRVLAKC